MAGRKVYGPGNWVFVVNPTNKTLMFKHRFFGNGEELPEKLWWDEKIPPYDVQAVHPYRQYQKTRGLAFLDTGTNSPDFRWIKAARHLRFLLAVGWELDEELNFET